MVTYPLVSIILIFIYLLIFLPYNLRKGFNLYEFLVRTVFALYIIAVIDVTFLPLPIDPRLIAYFIKDHSGELDNFIPFKSIYEIINNSVGFSVAVRQLGGNLLLLLPFGFYLPILSKKFNSFLMILLSGIVSACSIEIIQTLISRILGFTYRSTDIDDVILNTAGCLIGFLFFRLCYPIIKEFMASIDTEKFVEK